MPVRASLCSSSLTIVCLVLVTRPPRPAALRCFPGEYETHGQCCPMCSAGNRVVRHCKSNVSTTCIPCVHDTYTEHPNGLTECLRCKVCDAGARLMIKEKCTYAKNTICGCAPGDFCVHLGVRECEMCHRSTVCPPGSRVQEPGTEFSDNQCEVCPNGTFSASNMSRACQPWTKCEEQGMREAKAGTCISDAVCEQSSLSGPVIALIIILSVLLVSAGAGGAYCLSRWGKMKYDITHEQETEDVQNQAQLLKANRTDTLCVQETDKENDKISV